MGAGEATFELTAIDHLLNSIDDGSWLHMLGPSDDTYLYYVGAGYWLILRDGQMLRQNEAERTIRFGWIDQQTFNINMAEGEHSGEHEEHAGPLVVFFVVFGLLLGGLLREVNKKTKFPYTPLLILTGLFLGYFRNYLGDVGLSTSIV